MTGELIRQRIEELAMTQTALADAVDVAVQTVNKWVKGQTKPERSRWELLEQTLELPAGTIARALGVDDHPDIVGEVARLTAEVEELRTIVAGLVAQLRDH